VPDEAVSLELLVRLLREAQADMRAFRNEIAEFRDQMTVQTAILLRVEAGQNSMAEQLRAMASQHQRTDRRLLALDERLRALEEHSQ
jgi:septal ring factor EnvC (AmiA/AmiB activator)